MYKIIRLAAANIRRRRTESVLLGLLVMLCMALLSGALTAGKNTGRIFDDMMERTGICRNIIFINEDDYDERCLDFFDEDGRVTGYTMYRAVFAYSTRILDEGGKEKLYPASFITAEEDNKFERFTPQTSLSEAEISAMAHPIYVPLNEKRSLGLNEGDGFSVIEGSKKFDLTVAGFYESGYWDTPKFVVSEADYAVLKTLFERDCVIGFDLADDSEFDAVYDDWLLSADRLGMNTDNVTRENTENWSANFNNEIQYILIIMEVMSVMIFIAAAVMIAYRVVSDIREQIVQIGVLEALGYRSREIALSYAAEYFLITLAGCAVGTFGGIGIFYLLTDIAENMKGYAVSRTLDPAPVTALFIALLVVISLLALVKAWAVRKYPPVQALRKGIASHHFGKSRFPLRDTRGSVHLRLALKGAASRTRQNISLTFVMSMTVLAVVLSFILYSFLGRGMNMVYSIAGCEICDVEVSVMKEVDRDEFRRELEAMPEIRKVLPSSGSMGSVYIKDTGSDLELLANIYEDYTETENIRPMDGRFPEHDNEIMLTNMYASRMGIGTGDSIMLEYGSVRREYVVTGTVTAIVNGNGLFITEEGMKQLDPLYQPVSFQIYCSEGVSADELRRLLDRRFGKSAESMGKQSAESMGKQSAEQGSCEERVRARADRIISAMLEQTDAANVEYTIRSGDTVISGGSGNIKIKSFMNVPELLGSMMKTMCDAVSITTRLFMLISAAVVMMILSILMSSEIRRQRRELGIMKGMGYTSKELMLQLAFRIMPAVFAAVVLGTALAVFVTKLLVTTVGVVPINITAVILLDAVILMFCFGSAYLGARKIKKISVYELMTE